MGWPNGSGRAWWRGEWYDAMAYESGVGGCRGRVWWRSSPTVEGGRGVGAVRWCDETVRAPPRPQVANEAADVVRIGDKAEATWWMAEPVVA
jgi:hypothetical protein